MAMTGQDLWLYTRGIIDKDYSDWVSPQKANRMFSAALYNVIEQKLSVMDSQKIYDELNSLIRVNVPVPVTSNQIVKSAITPDYMRLLSVKADFICSFPVGIVSAQVLSSSPIKIILNKKTGLRSGSKITTSTIIGTLSQTSFYVKRLSDKIFSLYDDSSLLQPAALQSSSSPAIIKMVYSEYCFPYLSDRKINSLAKPSEFEPAYEDGADKIVFHPRSSTCTGATIDYISKPSVFVDVSDNTVDLEATYPKKFLYAIANEFANLFAMSTRDADLYRSTENEIIQNP